MSDTGKAAIEKVTGTQEPRKDSGVQSFAPRRIRRRFEGDRVEGFEREDFDFPETVDWRRVVVALMECMNLTQQQLAVAAAKGWRAPIETRSPGGAVAPPAINQGVISQMVLMSGNGARKSWAVCRRLESLYQLIPTARLAQVDYSKRAKSGRKPRDPAVIGRLRQAGVSID